MTRTFSRFWRADGLSAVCILVISIIVSGSAIGCEYGPDVTWVNQTDENIVIYLSDELSSDLGTHLPPQSTKTEFLGDDLWKGMVVVRDEQGNVLYRQELTWDEFKAMGYRFVITEDMLSPTPTGGGWLSVRVSDTTGLAGMMGSTACSAPTPLATTSGRIARSRL